MLMKSVLASDQRILKKPLQLSRRSKSVVASLLCMLNRLVVTDFDRRPIGDLVATSATSLRLSFFIVAERSQALWDRVFTGNIKKLNF